MTEDKAEEKQTEENLEPVDADQPDEEMSTLVSEAEDSVADLKAALSAAEQAGKEHEDRFMRLYAEFENYKKRSSREAREYRKFANEALIKEMLPVIDNLERAIQSSLGQENQKEGLNSCILEGVSMTLSEILKVMDRFHVKPVEALGKSFDPNFHEAVGQEESDEVDDNTVIREYQKGYLLHDRLIRPAMVVVSRGKPASAADEGASGGTPGSEPENGFENNDDPEH